MTDANRNTRTLIVCFSIAFMALIPLRFVEVGQVMEASFGSGARVLGETTQQETVTLMQTAEVGQVGLEAPYNEIDGPCLTSVDYANKMELVNGELNSKTITNKEKQELIKLSVSLDSRRCR